MNWLNVNSVCNILQQREVTEKQTFRAMIVLSGLYSMALVFPDDHINNWFLDYGNDLVSLAQTLITLFLAFKINQVTNVDFVVRFIMINFCLLLWTLLLSLPFGIVAYTLGEMFPLAFTKIEFGLLVLFDIVSLLFTLLLFKKVNSIS